MDWAVYVGAGLDLFLWKFDILFIVEFLYVSLSCFKDRASCNPGWPPSSTLLGLQVYSTTPIFLLDFCINFEFSKNHIRRCIACILSLRQDTPSTVSGANGSLVSQNLCPVCWKPWVPEWHLQAHLLAKVTLSLWSPSLSTLMVHATTPKSRTGTRNVV